ncbi:hypothetical protein FXO37_33598 [Capsicum annuum]|nr:hypothetical protein FXO37_33598 [Capsicum annuum]
MRYVMNSRNTLLGKSLLKTPCGKRKRVPHGFNGGKQKLSGPYNRSPDFKSQNLLGLANKPNNLWSLLLNSNLYWTFLVITLVVTPGNWSSRAACTWVKKLTVNEKNIYRLRNYQWRKIYSNMELGCVEVDDQRDYSENQLVFLTNQGR